MFGSNMFQDCIIQLIKMISEQNTILVNEIIENRNIIESIKSDKQKDIEIKELQDHILKITNDKALVIEELNHKLLIAKRESQIRGLKIHELESSFNKRNEKIKQQNKNIKYLSEKLKSIEVKEPNEIKTINENIENKQYSCKINNDIVGSLYVTKVEKKYV